MTLRQFPLQMAEAGGEVAGGTGTGGTDEAGQGTGTQGTQDASLLASGDGSNLLDWRTSLPDNLRSAPIITRHATMEAAAKSLVAQDELIGRGIFLPREEPGSEAHTAAMQKIYDKLGRPTTAKDYTLTAPEGRTMDADVGERWKAAFHKAGLSQAQVDEVLGEYWRTVNFAENIHAGADARSYEEGRRALYAEFGASTDAMIGQARAFAEHFGAGAFGGQAGEKFWEELMQAKLPDGSMVRNSPHMMAVFAEAGKRLGEGEFLDSDYYKPGQNTLEVLSQRQKDLTAKRFSPEGLSSDEQSELLRINTQIVAARERASRGSRVA
jgi:hypothetical protein